MRIRLSVIWLSFLAVVVPCAALSRPIERPARDFKPFSNLLITRIPESTAVPRMPVSFAVQGQRGTITGRIVLPSGPSVNNRVRITLSGGRITSQTTFTDNKGWFTFTGVSDGTYTLEILGDPALYEPVTQEVRLIYGAHPVLVISLREKETTSNKPKTNVVSAVELDQQVPTAAAKEFEKGVQLSNQGKFEDAAGRFKKALDIFPSYLMARNNLGVQYLKMGRWAEAAEQFEAAIEINPKTFSSSLNLGIALIELRKYAEAVEGLNQAIALDSSSAAAHLYLGVASIGTNAIDQAERELTTALSLGGAAHSIAHFYLALVHIKKAEPEAATVQLKAYLEKEPKGDKAPRAKQLLEKLKQ
jgi:Tfp pilus assembly protein PilF